VQEEREILEDVIRELNITWSEKFSIRLDLIRWETHGYPSMGDHPQSVINNQMGDNYDIFIGILWKKFGTPTDIAESGTIEEFERAHERFSQNPNEVKIMFYFNNTPVTPSEIDPMALTAIQKFKRDLGEMGGLYWNYADVNEFESLARLHLSRQVQEWVKILSGSQTIDKGSNAHIIQKTQINEKEEEGLLDLIENVQKNFEISTNTIMKIANEIQNLGFKVEQKGPEITRLQSSSQTDIATLKRAYNRIADDFNEFVEVMEKEIPKFSYSYSNAIESIATISTILNDFTFENEDELHKLLDMIINLKKGMEPGLDGIIKFESSIKPLPRVSSKFNHSKRRTLNVLEKFKNELQKSLTMTLEVEKALEKTILEYKNYQIEE
jgi:hypothetical protein